MFDEVDVQLGLNRGADLSRGVVMTSWHADEPLLEALEFFWTTAVPGAGKTYGPTHLALSVGSAHLRIALQDAAATVVS